MKQQILQILNEFAQKEFDSFGNPCISKSDFPKLAERLDRLNEWVSVDERYPDKYGLYWVCRKDGKMHAEIWNNTSFAHNQSVITHWQPLPSPPKQS